MTQNGRSTRSRPPRPTTPMRSPWADASQRLAQDGAGRGRELHGRRGELGSRQDRGIDGTAPYLYILKPAGSRITKPRRGLRSMPAILTEVGSISLDVESRAAGHSPPDARRRHRGSSTASPRTSAAAAGGCRIDALVPGGAAGRSRTAVAGDGPPFWPPVAPADRQLTVRVVNTGIDRWPAGMRLAAGWGAPRIPYLAAAPAGLRTAAMRRCPRSAPASRSSCPSSLPACRAGRRQVAWITLIGADGTPRQRNRIRSAAAREQGP